MKGLLIALVVLGHAYQNLVFQSSGPEVGGLFRDPVFKGIYLFHMPLFFLISGYLRALHPPADGESWRFVLRRAGRLILPAVAWFVVIGFTSFICLGFFLGHFDLPSAHPVDLLKNLLVQSWFVWCVFFFDLLIALLRKFRLDKALCLLPLCVAALFLPHVSIVFLVQYALPFLSLGYLFGSRSRPFDFTPSLLWCALAGVVFWAIWMRWQVQDSVYLGTWSLWRNSVGNVLLRFLCQAAASLCALLFLLRLCRVKRLQFFASWGRSSLGIYFLQTFFYSFTPLLFLQLCLHLQVQPQFDDAWARLSFALLVWFVIMALCLSFLRLLALRRFCSRLFLGIAS